MPIPVNPMGYNPLFQATMPNDYSNPMNFGAYGTNPEASGWGVNPSYLTPSFLAPYRPQYGGNPNFQMPPMSFGKAVNTLTPWSPDAPYYTNPQMYNAHAANEVGNKVSDAGMTAGQFILPAAVGLATMAAVDSIRINTPSDRLFRPIAEAFNNAAPRWMGGAATSTQAAQLARSQTILEAGARRVGQGAGGIAGGLVGGAGNLAARILGKRMPDGFARGAASFGARAGSFAGAVAGRLFLPWAVAESAMDLTNAAIFDPYVHGRQTMDMIQQSMAGTYTGLGLEGNPLGVSAANASNMGFEITRSFKNNMVFGGEAGADIFSGAMKHGLLNGTAFNTGDIKKKVQEVSRSISLMMSVFNDPSTQDALERLGSLAEAGGIKSPSAIANLAMQYKTTSATTGIGTRELMAGIGAQGQMMFAQAGMMPFLGQQAALNAMGGISAAYRSGLVSTTSLAMLGGAQGAAQLSMQAQLGISSTPFFQMSAFNRMRGGGGRGLVGEMTEFGSRMVENPLAGYGDYMMNKETASSNMLRDNPMSLIKSVTDIGRTMPGFYLPDGRINPNSFATVAMGMGLSPMQVKALFAQIEGQYKENIGGVHAAAFESSRAEFFNQQGLTYYGDSPFSPGRIPYAWTRGKRNMYNWGSNLTQEASSFGANISDALVNIMHGASNNAKIPTQSGGFRYKPLQVQSGIDALGGSWDKSLTTSLLDIPAHVLKFYNNAFFPPSGDPTPDDLSNIAKLDALTGDKLKNLPTGTTFSHEVLGRVMADSKISTIEGARRALTFRNTRTAVPGAVATNGNFMGSVTQSMRDNLGLQHQSGMWSTLKHSLMGTYRDSATAEVQVNALTESEKLALMVFAFRNNIALGTDEGFLMAVSSQPYIRRIISKLGFEKALSGNDKAALTEARTTILSMTNAVSYSSDSSPLAAAMVMAANSVTPEGEIKEIDVNAVKTAMPRATELASRVQRSGTPASGTIASIKEDPQAFTMSFEMLKGKLLNVGKNLGNSRPGFGDFGDLLQASSDQKDAADIQIRAATLMAASVDIFRLSLKKDKAGYLVGEDADRLSRAEAQVATMQ